VPDTHFMKNLFLYNAWWWRYLSARQLCKLSG